MRLLLSSVLLGSVWFVAVNAIVSLMAWPFGSWMLGRFRNSSPRRVGAGMLLTTRLLPAVAAAVFVLAVFLPAHWRFEPADTDEVLRPRARRPCRNRSLAGAAQCVAWRSGGRRRSPLRRRARRTGTLVEGDAHGAFELGGLPGVSLAGIWRPRILIGSEALSALTPAELDVAIAHEVAHRRSQDNLKRFLMFCAPDLFGWTRVARQLEEGWQAEAECEADAAPSGATASARSCSRRPSSRWPDSGAPGRFTRSRPWGRQERRRGLPSWRLWSAFHVPTLLEVRVRRLVSSSAVPPVVAGRLGWSTATLGLGILVGLWLLDFAHTLHLVTEAMVTLLP